MRKIFLSYRKRLNLKRSNIRINIGLFERVRAKDDSVVIEPHCNFPMGTKRVWDMGAFSYSRSVLPVDCRVGRYCSIASNVKSLGFQHPMDRFTTSPVTYSNNFRVDQCALEKAAVKKSESFVIENDVWIGEDVVIKPGVTIHNGAIVGARSIVTKDVPPYAIVVGAPAKIIRYRFPKEIIKKLLGQAWWEYNYTEFDGVSSLDSISEFVDKMDELIEEGKVGIYNPEKFIL